VTSPGEENLTHVVVASKGLGHVTRGVLVEFLVVTEYDDRDVHGTKNSELMRLLEQTTLSLQECAAPSKSVIWMMRMSSA